MGFIFFIYLFIYFFVNFIDVWMPVGESLTNWIKLLILICLYVIPQRL